MSCLSASIRILNEPLIIAVEQAEFFSAIVSLVNEPMVASCNMVCSIGMDNGREVFMVKEGVFLLADGDTFKVIKSYELQ